MKVFSSRAMLAATLFFVPVASQASLILGQLAIAGNVTISAPGGVGTVAFSPLVPPPGTFAVTSSIAQTGGFVALANTTGNIMNIGGAADPVNTTLSVANFVTFNAVGFSNISFTLTKVLAGVDTSAGCAAPATAGQICTPSPSSPFNLQNQTASTSTATFSIQGLEVDSSTGLTANVVGTFSSNFNTSLQDLLAAVATGSVTNSFAGTFIVSAVPEPASLIQFGTGGLLLAIGAIARRKRQTA